MRETTEPTARVAALVGPQRSGKTSLLESLLRASGAIAKKGRVRAASCVSDAAPEARSRGMSVEVTPVAADYLGERWTWLDCPGSVELAACAHAALAVADVAVVVCEPDPDRAIGAAPILRHLDAHAIPHVIFINKVDDTREASRLRDTFEAIRSVSARPLVMRELPIVNGSEVSGMVELVRLRAYAHDPEVETKPKVGAKAKADVDVARARLLEAVADFDDPILEKLVDDQEPSTEEVYASLRRDLEADRLISVFFGSAELDFGIERLLKALRHETPSARVTAKRLGIPEGASSVARICKTVHAPHLGKLSYARVFRSRLVEGGALGGLPTSGLVHRLTLTGTGRVASVEEGEVVALSRFESFATGDTFDGSRKLNLPFPVPDEPVYSVALTNVKSSDDAKLGLALSKLVDEDPSIRVEMRAETQERLLRGAGEIHLEITLARLASRFGMEPRVTVPEVPYRETIRRSAEQHGRYRHQSGGHGQFGDVILRIEPLAPGQGFRFVESVVGGAVPRQYFGAIEAACVEALTCGPLGFPVVDVRVTLLGGSYHSVDSSDQAFKAATRIALSEGLAACDPVLLEPIDEVRLYAPREFLPKVQRLVSSRRGGQILGYDEKPGWPGWDELVAHIPRAETNGLVVELRSLTQGLGSFVAQHHHDRPVLGKDAERALEGRRRKSA